MAISERYEKAVELLNKHGQGHLLAFYDELDGRQKDSLLEEIERLDFTKIPGWIENHVKNESPVAIPVDFLPADSYGATPSPDQEKSYEQAQKRGEQLLSQGKVAAFVVAGGQGTRLGFDGAKGNYPISPIKNKTLFQLFAETILAASKKYGVSLPWYIMASPLNYSATVEIFQSHDYYGLKKEDVFIFQQGTLPNFSFDGKILMSDKGTIATSPDGHGGSLKALYDSGAIADMKRRTVEFISYFQVDNPLVEIFCPLFIGLNSMQGSQMSSRSLVKAHPTEKIGNFCLVDNRMTVFEYSDLPDKYANKRNADGSLVFELGSIAIHIISVSFVEKLNENVDGFVLPIHRAVKKIPFVDSKGKLVKPAGPNGVKLETFVFDALPFAEKSIILRTIRSQEFAPVKNAFGEDSAEITRHMISARAANWLESAGIEVPRTPDGSPDCVIEIDPAFAICKEDVAEKKDNIPPIKPKEGFYLQ